jgi:putative Mg2+ transporter-C (MgtC) family protein
LRRRPAGLRVCIIVTLTTGLFVTLGMIAMPEGADPTRIMSGIVTGVGCLGAGVIFSNGGRVQGITTAALIWALAAIGMTIGLAYPITAIFTTIVLITVVVLIGWAEQRLPWLMPEAEAQSKD